MISKPCALPLEWWIKVVQGHSQSFNVRTKQLSDGKYELYEWAVGNIAKPTDKQVEQIIKDYEAASSPLEPNNKKRLLKDLGLEQKHLDKLKELTPRAITP